MSLFNRLDKIRNRGEGKDEEGMFSIPDLGPRPTSNQAPPPPPPKASEPEKAPENTGAPAPSPASNPPSTSVFAQEHRPSPLERLQRRHDEATRAPEAAAPASPPVEESEARTEEIDQTEVPWPVTPFRRPALFGESAASAKANNDEEASPEASVPESDAIRAAETVFASAPLSPSEPEAFEPEATEEAATLPEATTPETTEPEVAEPEITEPEFTAAETAAPPVSYEAVAYEPDGEAPAAEAPAAEAPVRTTAFDRLMAARAKTERPGPERPVQPSVSQPENETRSNNYSLTERLAAMRAPEAPEAPSPEIPIAEAPLDPEQSLETVDAPAEAIEAPEAEAVATAPATEVHPPTEAAAPELTEELIAEATAETPRETAFIPAEETPVPEMSSASWPEPSFPEPEEESVTAANEPAFEAAEPPVTEFAAAELEVQPEIGTAPESDPFEAAAESVGTSFATHTESEPALPTAPTPAPEPAPVSVPAGPSNSPLSLRERLAMQGHPSAEVPEPTTQPIQSPAPTPTVMRPTTLQDRFAARENLDRSSGQPAPEAPPTVTNPVSPGPLSTGHSSAIERPGETLSRIDNEGPTSEREIRNRALYRQKHLIFDSVLGSLDPRILQDPRKDALRPALEKAVDGAAREWNLVLEGSDRTWMVDEFLREVTDVGPLVPLLEDPTVNKILVAGANDVAVEKLGRIERTGISFRDDDHLLAVVRRIAEMTGGRLDAKVPLLDRPLPDGARIRAKIPPLAPQPTLTIEKSSGNPLAALKRQQAERGRAESLPYSQLRERIQQRLLREFESNTGAVNNPERLRAQVEEMIAQVIAEERVVVTRAEKAALVMDLLNEIVGLGPLEPLLNDPEVDEIMVNGPFQIYVERKGKLEISGQRFRDNGHVMQVIDRIIAPLGRRVDEKSPMVDGRLRDGSRFNAIIPPLALSGPTMTIRKFARDPFTMTDLINFGSLTREAAQFLQAAVEGRLNIVVSGGTGSGKTTTLNVLSSFIPASERIVTIEDAAELQLRQEHVIRLETRPPNIEGVGEVGIRDLVRNALRMRPDRIVVGECRGGEALDMLQAMNTGHDGSLTTGHSNGPRDTLKRLETMVMMAGFDLPIKAIREQIAMAVQLIVHQERMRDGKRRITAITELVGMEGDVITMQDLYRFEQDRVDDEGRIIGSLVPTGLRPKNYDTIVDNGVELTMEIFQPRSMNENGVRSRLADHRIGGVR